MLQSKEETYDIRKLKLKPLLRGQTQEQREREKLESWSSSNASTQPRLPS
jgi:hypothetical protein